MLKTYRHSFETWTFFLDIDILLRPESKLGNRGKRPGKSERRQEKARESQRKRETEREQ